jgi:VIT1/CCC1 family predicted Fe2+/Mn2+ transporter
VTKVTREQQTIIVRDDEVPAHLFDETEPTVTVRHFEWSTSTGRFGGLLAAIPGALVVFAVFFLALAGVWLLLLAAFALGMFAVIRSLLFPTGRHK